MSSMNVTTFSDEVYFAISKYPLEPILGSLRVRPSLQAVISYDDTKHELFSDEEYADAKDAITALILALQGHHVAKKLPSKNSSGTVRGQLGMLLARLDSDQVNIRLFEDLVRVVVQRDSDVKLWKEVLRLIDETSRLSPEGSAEPSFGGTPRSTNSSSHQGSEQTKKLLQEALRDELWDCSYINVSGFFEKYFENKSWTQKCKNIYNSMRDTYLDNHWTTFPEHPTESAVWSWWNRMQSEHLTESRSVYHSTQSKTEMIGLDSEGQLDLLVKSRDSPTLDQHDWANVLVIGEHTVSRDIQKFLQLARYARSVFSTQPRRRFLHSFILSHTKMELHVFDRSGAYSADPFDIHEQPERFIQAITGYCMMSDEDLGLDTFIDRENSEQSITVTSEAASKDLRVQLEPHPIVRQPVIVGRSTSCYRTTDKKQVVKFSWVSTTRTPTEPDILRLAHERRVKGIPNLIGHRRITTTGGLRSQLLFSKRRQLRGRLRLNYNSSLTQFVSKNLSDLSEEPDERTGRKRKSTDLDHISSLKKSRSNSRTSRPSQSFGADGTLDSQTSITSLRSGEPFIDRVLSCQVTSPAGRPLKEFRTVTELLLALRDTIKIHHSLFNAKILHRDISESNIVLTNPDSNNGSFGMLIDLELAATVENGKNSRTNGKRMTGTLKFMAIQVVEIALRDLHPDLEHTYRHDLESFFYVFISICVSHGWGKGKGPSADPLQHWYIGSFEDIARAKTGDIAEFKDYILKKFSPRFNRVKGLAMSLRNSLFLPGRQRKDTPIGDPSVLYGQMIDAFDKTIESLAD